MTREEFERDYKALVARVTTDRPIGFSVEGALAAPIALPLRFVLEWAGQSRLNQVHNQLLDPASYVRDEEGMIEFAAENQNVVSWGFSAEPAEDPIVYQKAHEEVGDGPWVEDGKNMSEFLLAFAYWNAAFGGADATIVGEIGRETRARLRQFETVFTTNDFSVHRSGDVFLLATTDDDLFAFGRAQAGLRWLVKELDAAWTDYEHR